jgi:hypothetical protein
MLSNPDVAKQISDLMMDIFVRVDASVTMVRESCAADEAAAYRKATAGVVGAIVMDVLAPLYEKNPTLKPSNWDD